MNAWLIYSDRIRNMVYDIRSGNIPLTALLTA